MVGDRLKQIIKALNLTQQNVSDSIGISRPYVSQLISGKYELTKTIALALKAEFNVNPTWLLTGEGEMFLPHPPAPSPEREGEKEEQKKRSQNGNHLSVHNGNVKEYPDIDDSDQIARTAWYRDLPDVNQWIINAMDELRNDEALEQVKRLLTQLVVRQREDSRLARDVEELIEKMKAEHEADIRKKGEAG